jgi:hypothetical protein
MIGELLEPMMHLNKVNTNRNNEFKEVLEWIRNGQLEITSKIEDGASLKEIIKDSKKLSQLLHKQSTAEIDVLHTKIANME